MSDYNDRAVLYAEDGDRFSDAEELKDYLASILKVDDYSNTANDAISRNYIYFFRDGVKINRIPFPAAEGDRKELLKTLYNRFLHEGIEDPRMLRNLCRSIVEFCNDTQSIRFEQFHLDLADRLFDKLSTNKTVNPVIVLAKIDEEDEPPVLHFLYFSNDPEIHLSDILEIES